MIRPFLEAHVMRKVKDFLEVDQTDWEILYSTAGGEYWIGLREHVKQMVECQAQIVTPSLIGQYQT